MRWKWFFNKNKDPEDIEDNYEKKPWDERSKRTAPVATDAPELEAFFASIERDLKDLGLRRKVKGNLNSEQIKFIKEVKEEYPGRGLRIRREDKGPRFVIEDAVAEDERIQAKLSDNRYYTEMNDDPKEEFIEAIKSFAEEAFENEEIDDKQYNFITNIEDSHLAVPKPLYKTHKKDENGEMVNPVPIRCLTVGCGTPVHPLSKLCQLAIEHLTSKEELPRNLKSTKEALRVVNEINENNTPLPDEAAIALCDISNMYPNVDVEEGLSSIERRLQTNPSPLGISPATIVEGLRICMRCNCVKFKGKFYLPNRGVAMGSCHACDFSDVWMGDITEHHINTCTVDTLKFHLYRDDGIDIILSGDQDKERLVNHLNNLHPNLTWTVDIAKEGGYLDLWLMIEEGRIEWKNFRKAPPIYVGPDSNHDPAVIGGILPGVGHRLRLNSSKNEYFEEAVEDAARGFAISGYNYQKAKQELLKFKDQDPIELIKRPRRAKKKPDKGVQAFFISEYDPRMPHPRQLLSRNFHHIQSNPELVELFPRENLIGGTRRGKNLSEILSPTVQSGPGPPGDADGGDEDDDAGPDVTSGANGGRWNGSYHCRYHNQTARCDLCSQMVETSTVTSIYFKQKFAIHGRNIHLPASTKKPLRWFVYVVHDLECQLVYVGSTSNACKRWAACKTAIRRKETNTGLYQHHLTCPAYQESGEFSHLTWTLVDHIDTSEQKLAEVGHTGGAKCRCSECQRLKDEEDKWICRLGSFHQPGGLNFRDEIKSRVRVNFRDRDVGGNL